MRKEETSPGNSQFAIRNSQGARRGSALLIVLGMLSFMVVSAVGFSLYMRQSRAPSSYLRRNIAARYLVKAALANAIEELEGAYNENRTWGIRENERTDNNPKHDYLSDNHFYGIFDDPYPGCGPDNQEFSGKPEGNGNYWLKRVFCPFGPVREPTGVNEASDETKANPTVPTLTLEALAYLPPAIADDVRKVSRLTRTACWRPLPYDSGRYAYTAVNVSDLFDINRLTAEPRDSGANRISLASLLTTSAQQPTKLDGDADKLATAVDWTQAATINGKTVPWVSLADFALANAAPKNSEYSPFSKFIGTSGNQLLQGNKPTEANALFMTDTWFPPTNAVAGTTYDLGGGDQPFTDFTVDELITLETKLNKTKHAGAGYSVGEIFVRNLGPSIACLWDYLDSDSQPISLAFPTTEAVPMVVAVGAPMNLKPRVNPTSTSKSAPLQSGNHKYNVTRTITRYAIDSFSGTRPAVSVALVYPFKRMATTKRKDITHFKVRGVLRVFAVPVSVGSYFGQHPTRPREDGLRPDDKTMFNLSSKSCVRGIATFASDYADVTFDDDNANQGTRNWIKEVGLTFDTDGMDIPIFQKVEETWTGIIEDPDNPPPSVEKDSIHTLEGLNCADTALFCPVTAEGGLTDVTAWKGEAELSKDITMPISAAGSTIGGVTAWNLPTDKYKLYAALWIQVIEDSGFKVYDMVPACAADDALWLGSSGNAPSMIIGEDTPLLDFIADYGGAGGFAIDETMPQTFASDAQFPDRTALYAVDPRFNHAPENWFYRKDGNNNLRDKWCTALGIPLSGIGDKDGGVFGQDGRDRDVFMFVSDQEYLQDIGELQFLPALVDIDGFGAHTLVNDTIYTAGTWCDGRNYVEVPEMLTKDQLENRNVFCDGPNFWRTYTAYETESGVEPDRIYALRGSGTSSEGVRFHSSVGGFRLNPYSDDDRVICAAVCGTPFDYYVASTNDQQKQSGGHQNTLRNSISTVNDMRSYSFGSDCASAKISDDTMLGIVDVIKEKFAQMAQNGKTDFDEAWNSFAWQDVATTKVGDANDTFLDASIKPESVLHGVDRKFLYSFWRECFDNRQQLFLIFVRAEPASVGCGDSSSLSSAQLGGRAVALVWRDPAVPTMNIGQRKRRDEFRKLNDSTKEAFRKMKKECPPHQTRILFYHQFD